MSDADPLARVVAARRAVDDAQAELREAVADAHAAGRSWADVGSALGVSRQAAFKRFGAPVDPRTGGTMTRRTGTDVTALALRTLQMMADGQVDRVRASMTVETAETLTADRLNDTWARAVADTGPLVSATPVSARTPAGDPLDADEAATGVLVGVVELACEAGEWEGRVASDGDGRVVGMLICPPGATGLAF